ncbi:pre-mRNA-splicing factor cwc22-like [Spinacia oleracea]|uniref:Pre-mRNA-splicing factor cwc22-like n=1 Tax=Spinacia oleracea TaxID=3562 RepID=A0ABM3QYV0_SPIOL|nr:pre-mRNA-splicing factor cwc22-like [Spinacia oleracea]
MTSSAGFQDAFSANSGSEVDDSAVTHLGCGGSGAEFWGDSVESTQTELVPGYTAITTTATMAGLLRQKYLVGNGSFFRFSPALAIPQLVIHWFCLVAVVAQSRPNDDDEDDDEDDEDDEEQQMQIKDETETNLINLRRTIYLTIMSSVDFEEAGHKLLKIKLEPGQEMELNIILLECCSQERTYLRYYGLLGQRFCMLNRVYQENFEKFDFPKLIFG